MEWRADHRSTCEYHHPPLSRIALAWGPYLAGARSNSSENMAEEGRAILRYGGLYWRNLTFARAGIRPFYWLAC